jgi:hypothetical protein
MKTHGILALLLIIIIGGCSDNSTEPTPVAQTRISVTGDISESYDAVAYYTPATFENDTVKEYLVILILPRTTGDNILAGAWLYKSGAELPEKRNYQIGEYAFGDDIPADKFGGSYSGLDADDFSGYSMTEGLLNIQSVSVSKITGEFSMTGYWRMGIDSDSSRIVTVTGKFSAAPAPEEEW